MKERIDQNDPWVIDYVKYVKRSKYSFHDFSSKHTPSATLNNWNPRHPKTLFTNLVKIGPVVLEKKVF